MTTTVARAPRGGILALKDVQVIAEMIARKEAHCDDDVDDLVQVALLAYFKVVVRARTERMLIVKPFAFARLTCLRAMRGYYWQQREWQGRGEPNKAVSIEVAEVRATPGEQLELVEMHDYFTVLERYCGPSARIIVENLVLPSGACCARVLEEVRTKRDAQQACAGSARRNQPRGVKKGIRITHRLIRDALGITPAEWSRTMTQIRTFTRAYLSQ